MAVYRPTNLADTIIHSFIQEFIKRPFKKSTQRRPQQSGAYT